MESAAVKLFRVSNPREGGQSMKMKSKSSDISSNALFIILSLSGMSTSSMAAPAR